MTGLIDLEAEMWRSIENVRQPHIDRLIALGVSGGALAGLGCVQPPFGVARIRRLSGGLYEPDSDGDPAVIVPVYEPTDLGLLGMVDLIAWATRDPACWSWRIGHAWALRDDLLDGNLPVSVVETPLDWLKAGGEAMCILLLVGPGSMLGAIALRPITSIQQRRSVSKDPQRPCRDGVNADHGDFQCRLIWPMLSATILHRCSAQSICTIS